MLASGLFRKGQDAFGDTEFVAAVKSTVINKLLPAEETKTRLSECLAGHPPQQVALFYSTNMNE